MGQKRKDALIVLNSLLPGVLFHLRKLEEDPANTAAAHWRWETHIWLRDMEDSLSAVGRKTAAEWQLRIDAYRAQLGEHGDE